MRSSDGTIGLTLLYFDAVINNEMHHLKQRINTASSEGQRGRGSNKGSGENAECSRISFLTVYLVELKGYRGILLNDPVHNHHLQRSSYWDMPQYALNVELATGKTEQHLSVRNKYVTMKSLKKVPRTELCSIFQKMVTSTAQLIAMLFQIWIEYKQDYYVLHHWT